jgi:hypothetical protein
LSWTNYSISTRADSGNITQCQLSVVSERNRWMSTLSCSLRAFASNQRLQIDVGNFHTFDGYLSAVTIAPA